MASALQLLMLQEIAARYPMFNMYPMAVYSSLILDFRNTLQNVLIGPGRKTRPERPIENHTTKGVENDIIAEKREVWYNSIAAAVRITP